MRTELGREHFAGPNNLKHYDSIAEIAALNENLDNLNAALDTIEQRADSMKEKVLELLMSNREITKALREEQHSQIEPTGDSGQCNHRKGDPAKEA